MPAISKIRFTNVVFEDGNKRYNDDIFHFDGENGAVLLENGGGKTVFIQTAIQAIIPHTNLADRKIKETLKLEEGPAHIGIEWIINEKPRRYALTAVTLYLGQDKVESYRFVDEYSQDDKWSLSEMPFVIETASGKRPADKGEMYDYYRGRTAYNGQLFETIKSFKEYIEDTYAIIEKEWESIVKINSAEGGVEAFFDECKTSKQLFERLLIPTVENAMAANDGETFVDIFSTRRKGFKDYQHFQETIQENQIIDEKLKNYVEVFSNLNDELGVYEKEKRVGKAYYLFYEEKLAQVIAEIDSLKEAFEVLKTSLGDHEKKQLCYQIAVAADILAKKQEELEEALRVFDLEKEKLSETNQSYYSLKYAMYKEEIEAGKGRLTVLSEQIENLDKELNIEELKEEQERNFQEINGYFIKLKDRFERIVKDLTQEKSAFQNSLDNTKTELDRATEVWRQSDKQQAIIKNDIEKLTEDLRSLANQLTINLKEETITDVLHRWSEKAVTLDTEITNMKTENSKLGKELIKVNEDQEQNKQELHNLALLHSEKTKDRDFLESQHDELKEEIRGLNRKWELLISLYMKQDSIIAEMDNEISLLRGKKDKLMKKERLAFRYVDDYQEIKTFFADRQIADLVEGWKSQFDYLVTGNEYLQQVGVNVAELDGDHYWPITLVTTSDEKQSLLDRVKKHHLEIQYPIIVLSNDEAHDQLEKNSRQSNSVLPNHWHSNTDQNQFELWKQKLLSSAEACKEEREQVENTLTIWTNLKERLKRFYFQYPQVDYHDLGKELQKLEHEKIQLKQLILKKDERFREINETIANQTKKISDNDSLLREVNGYVEKCQSYLQLAKKQEKLVTELHEKEAECEKNKRPINVLKRQLEDIDLQLKDVEAKINDHKYETRTKIYDQELYKQTKTVEQPIYSNKPISQLAETKYFIERNLNEHSTERTQLIEQKKQLQVVIEKATEELASTKRQFEDIDQTVDFPSDGKEKMIDLENKQREIKSDIKRTEDHYNLANESFLIQKGKWEKEREDFLKKYDESNIITFTISLATVKDELKNEQLQLQKRSKQLYEAKEKAEKVQQELTAILQEYKILDSKHECLAPAIQLIVLTEDVLNALPYEQNAIFKKVEAKLAEQKALVAKYEDLLAVEREKLKDFCSNQIKNSKLRERTSNGLNLYRTYEDILEFQKRTAETLTHAIQVAEAGMKKEDQEIEQFIHRMYTHIEKLVQELYIIPKKTKVKVEDSWKTIYDFSIPEWNEDEAKQGLRQYIQSLVNRLDSERYQDETGKENAAKVQQEVEQALHSRQLLHIITKQQELSVVCRKVTNDRSVTSRKYPWKSTNNWSGGEKWSKNMTLFLGLLNYIAEKRQDIRPSKKRNRTVIVDNPFGKASSEHVLQPVFFIAEQLGFQIIALTAHAEGKFLKDYFPVIYSCRLREAGSSGKQIVTKEKQIRTAYFQDSDPDALLRLGEQEQMELF